MWKLDEEDIYIPRSASLDVFVYVWLFINSSLSSFGNAVNSKSEENISLVSDAASHWSTQRSSSISKIVCPIPQIHFLADTEKRVLPGRKKRSSF